MRFVMIAVLLALAAHSARADEAMPPVSGPEQPRVLPQRGEDGIYHQEWFVSSFLDLREDHAEAKAAGKRFAVFIEQRGCIYCVKMHTEVLTKKYINDYVRENFAIVQLNLWGERLVTDAEVLQEILHRYHAIRRPDAIQPAFDLLRGVVDEVFPIEQSDVERAKALLLGIPGLSARDAVHAAVMRRRAVSVLLSFDTGFDRVAGLARFA